MCGLFFAKVAKFFLRKLSKCGLFSERCPKKYKEGGYFLKKVVKK